MTVGMLEARLRNYPKSAQVLILVTVGETQMGVKIHDDLKPTFIRPDVESLPSSILLVPECELVKA